MKKEIELKFKIENLEEIKEKIKKAGGKGGVEFFQKTIRLDTPSKDLEKKGIFLRARKEIEDTMTMKIKRNNNNNFFEREEYEIKVEDAEEAARMMKMLGFSEEKVLEKYRTVFKLRNLTLSLDRLPFGNYLEIEGEEKDIEIAVKELKLKNRIVVSYWDLSFEENIKF